MPCQDLEADLDLLRQPAPGAPRAGRADRLRPRGDPHLRPGLRAGGGPEAAPGRGGQAGLLGRLQELRRTHVMVNCSATDEFDPGNGPIKSRNKINFGILKVF